MNYKGIFLNFITLDEKDDIINAIKAAKKKQKNIVWQITAGKRKVFFIEKTDFDPVREIIRFKITNEISFHDDAPIYIKLAHRNTIFKGSIEIIQKQFIFIKVPDEIKLEEYREYERFHFTPDEKRNIFVNVDSQLMAKSKTHLPVNLLDVSRSGIALMMGRGVKDLMLLSGDVSLSSLGPLDFETDFFMDIIHTNDMKYTDENGVTHGVYKFGCKFRENLSEEFLIKFLKHLEEQNTNELGFLGNNHKFKKSISKEYKKTLAKITNKGDYGDFFVNIEKLDFKATGYLPKHIKFLASISCALVNLIGVLEENIVIQLTYCAFVHDIAFFNNAKLAEIKSREHFDEVRSHLTQEEVDLYQRSGNIAHEYSISDLEAPAGAQFILSQLKELDQSDNQSKILMNPFLAQSVAIFVIAHDLANYIVSRPQWTFHQYLEQYPFRDYPGTFQDVYDQLLLARKKATA